MQQSGTRGTHHVGRPCLVVGDWGVPNGPEPKSSHLSRRWFAQGLMQAFAAHGWDLVGIDESLANGHPGARGGDAGFDAGVPSGPGNGGNAAEPGLVPRVVLNFVEADSPRPYRRKAQATFVVTITDSHDAPEDLLKTIYPILVRNLSNIAVLVLWSDTGCQVHFVTLELGHFAVRYRLGRDPEQFFRRIYEILEPLATSELVIDNKFVPDLPRELWQGDAITDSIARAGQKLDALNLLPAPFPLNDILPERDRRHVQLLYGIGGLSYGNISARRDATSFWMSASGVNKADLREIGRDVLLVTGYDSARNRIRLSVPPDVKPRRVSVDAIEHWMIYAEHPSVQAILHVHAWIDGVPSTVINYPCGTRQLAQAVADLVREADDPSRAVIGLKNHGLTITGRSLEEIFERIEGRINQRVPMSPPVVEDDGESQPVGVATHEERGAH